MYTFIVRIADLNIEITSVYEWVSNYCWKYKILTDKYDFKIKINQYDIANEREICKSKIDLPDKMFEATALYRKISKSIVDYDGFLFHAALFDLDGIGIAFTGKSKCGKTTHMKLWQQLHNERLKVVNGDKPIIRFLDGEYPLGYGTPWCGKENLGTNINTRLKHICFIEQSEKNETYRIDKSKCFERLIGQIFPSINSPQGIKVLSLINKLINSCEFWVIRCNTDIQAAQLAYENIIEKNKLC